MDYGYIKEGKVFRNGFMTFPEKEIGIVKQSEEETFQYFEERFNQVFNEVEDVQTKINEQANKGSFLIKVTNLKDSLPQFDALGDFESLYTRLQLLENELTEYIEQNRQKNLQIKTALLEELRVAAASHEWKSATATVKEIQQKWMKTGAVAAEHKDQIEGTYKQLINQFFERRDSFYADLDKMMVEKEEDYKRFLVHAKQIIERAEFGQLKSVQNRLKEEWKLLGKIKQERHQIFWNEFNAMLKGAYKQFKAKANSPESTAENENKKKQLIERLILMNQEVAPKVDLKSIMNEWRKIGAISRDSTQRLNLQFQELTSMLGEKMFLNSLLLRKAKKGMSEKETAILRVKLLQDLLRRDVAELMVFEENIEKFNTSKGLDNVLDHKLNQQRQKVEVKKNLLKELKRAQTAQ